MAGKLFDQQLGGLPHENRSSGGETEFQVPTASKLATYNTMQLVADPVPSTIFKQKSMITI